MTGPEVGIGVVGYGAMGVVAAAAALVPLGLAWRFACPARPAALAS